MAGALEFPLLTRWIITPQRWHHYSPHTHSHLDYLQSYELASTRKREKSPILEFEGRNTT